MWLLILNTKRNLLVSIHLISTSKMPTKEFTALRKPLTRFSSFVLLSYFLWKRQVPDSSKIQICFKPTVSSPNQFHTSVFAQWIDKIAKIKRNVILRYSFHIIFPNFLFLSHVFQTERVIIIKDYLCFSTKRKIAKQNQWLKWLTNLTLEMIAGK